jgi:hypothetical protein
VLKHAFGGLVYEIDAVDHLRVTAWYGIYVRTYRLISARVFCLRSDVHFLATLALSLIHMQFAHDFAAWFLRFPGLCRH